MSSPRPWGCFLYADDLEYGNFVFPTPVGVFLPGDKIKKSPVSLPHARGGVSYYHSLSRLGILSSPRPWGCFYDTILSYATKYVFPTPVGVFLSAAGEFYQWLGLPHARGGVSAPTGL